MKIKGILWRGKDPSYLYRSGRRRTPEESNRQEETQEVPKYEEMCRRFLADAQDFSEERSGRQELTVVFLIWTGREDTLRLKSI